MKNAFWRILVLVAVFISALSWRQASVGALAQQPETALGRIMRTGVIRCAYTTWAPYLMIDMKTGEKSGIAYDFMMALADELGVKVDWVEEVSWGNIRAGLDAKRYDMMCVPIWESGKYAAIMQLSRPIYDNELHAFAREDDHRFDENFESANKPGVRFVVTEGDVTQAVRRMRFSNARDLAMSPMTASEGEAILNVIGRKADIVLENKFGAEQYNKTASVKIKPIAGGLPVRLFANTFAMRLGEGELKAAVDSTINTLIKSGTAAEIVRKYPGFRLN